MNSVRSSLLLICISGCIFLACTEQSVALNEQLTEITHDGLSSVQLKNVDAAWARTDIDLHKYDKIILEQAGIHYRLGTDSTHGGSVNATRRAADEFVLTEEQKQQLKTIVSNAFSSELRRSKRFTLVNEPGPGTLLIRGALLDVVAKKPAAANKGSLVYVSQIGEATLVLEIFDSQTGTILARAIDHGIAGKPNAVTLGNMYTTWSEVEKVATQWARTLRVHLEAFCALK